MDPQLIKLSQRLDQVEGELKILRGDAAGLATTLGNVAAGLGSNYLMHRYVLAGLVAQLADESGLNLGRYLVWLRSKAAVLSQGELLLDLADTIERLAMGPNGP